MKKMLLCCVLIIMGICSIYSQNLATNGDFSSGNSGFTSDYLYAAVNATSSPGLYGINNNPSAWASNFTNCGDHTSGSGNMMLLDGSILGFADIVWAQTIPVVAGRNYVFSFWVQSLNIANPASLETYINGVSLGAAVSAPTTIACGNWLKITATWNSGASNSAMIQIHNNTTNAVGNDFALDDISFTALPTATISGSNSVCLNSVGNSITLTGANGIAPYTFVYNINGGASQSISTTLGNSTTVAVPTNIVGPFNYNLESVSYGTAPAPVFLQNQIGTATVNVLSLPTATISGDAYVCSGSTGVITFTGTPNATVNYTVNNGANQSILLSASGNATVTSPPLTASSVYDLVTVESNGTTNCTQNVTGSATLSVPTASVFGSTSIAPGVSAPITFFGTPGVTVNFTSSLGPGSVVLNSSGIGYYNIPYLDSTTVFSLVSATVGTCVTPLSGSVTITVLPFCSIAALPLAKVKIDAPQAVCNLGECTDLLARYTQISIPTDYTVCSIPYAPTFPFTGGTVIPVTGDDSWSPIVTLPFSFNFYGNCYNNVIVGTNGVITFDLVGQTPGGGCPWQFNQTIPNAGFPIKNAIYGVYQDTHIGAPPVVNPAIQNVNYYILSTGVNAAPNRVFVANFNELPQYSCLNSVGLQTSQIVIHETTNIIEVLVSKRTSCTSWNSGSGLIGIQNLAGTLATVPPVPLRNTGTWGATNEAWRFYPNATPSPIISELSWELNGSPIGAINENPLTVCPTASGTYSAVVKYKNCGLTSVVRDDVVLGVSPPLPVADPQNITFCSSSLPPYTVNIDQNAAMLSTVPLADQGNYIIKYYERFDDAKNDAPTNIDFLSVADLATYQVPLVPKTIYVRIEDLVTTGCSNIRSFVINVVSSPSGTFTYPGSPYCNNDATPQAPTLFGLTAGGTFTANSTDLTINATNGAITGSTSLAGVYLVSYDIPATALCPAYHEEASVEIIPCSCTVTASSTTPQTVCVGTAITPITYTSSIGATSASVPIADLPPGVSATFAGGTFTISGIPNTSGTYTFTVTCLTGLTDTCSFTSTIIVKALPTATISGTTMICSGTTATITFTGTPDAIVTYNIDGGSNLTITLDATGTASLPTPVLTTGRTYNLVSIVTANGLPNCSQTLTGSAIITVKALPTATISGTTTICSGTTAAITFTGTPGATVTYTVDTVTSQTVTLDASGNATVTTPILTANSVYDLVSVTTNGTPDCAQNQIGSVTITVKALPTATISGTTTICSGTTTLISFTGTPGATVTYSIGSTPSTTILLDATGTASITTAILTADTTYNLVSVASGGIPNCSQTLTGSAIVTIKAIPTATISGTTTICENTTATITFTGTPDAIVTYNIDGGSNLTITLDATGTASLPTPVLTTGRTYNLVSIVTANGLPNCSQTLTGSVVISTTALPTATILGTTTICENTTAVITFGGTPNATITYKVDLGADQTITLDATGAATLTTPILTANSTYDLVSVALNGASNCSQTQTGSVTITVKPLPTATISGTTTICSGTSTVITFTGTPNATVTYTVDTGANQTITLDATGIATLTTPTLTIDSTYNLVSVASGGIPNCSQTLTGSAIITIKAIPTATIAGTTMICENTTAAITFTGTPNATVTYTVDTVTAQVTLDTSGNATVTTPSLSANSTYDLVSIDSNGIPNCSQTLVGSVVITIKALPTATISGTTTICAGATTTITFSGSPNATVTYKIDNGADQTITLDATGVATLTTPSLNTNSTYDLVSVASNGTPNCSQTQTGSATVTVNQLPTASISGDTICSGTAGNVTFTGTPGATITYTIGAGTNQTAVLDATGNVIVPTSVLTADTTYNLVSVAVTGVSNCSQLLTGSALVSVLPLPTATISGTTQLCLNSAAPQITFTGANGQSPYTFTYSLNNGFPQTISTVLGSDSVTLNVATSAAGQFIYDLIAVSSVTTPSCNQPQIGSAIVTILGLPTATIAVANAQVCINDPLVPQITFTGTNGQSPYTFIYTINNGPIQTANSTVGNNSTTVNVSTIAAGTFVYDLVSVASATTPSCSQPQVGSVTVLVKPASTLTTTSTTTQSVCASTPITPIVLNIGGSATGASVSVLPTGLSGVLNAAGTTFTISGSPSQTGSFNYTVTTTGGCSPAAVVTGTIAVNPNVTIALTSAVGSNLQTLCINNNVGQIQYTTGNGAASASITSGGLPLGVNAIFSSGVLTISGTALEAGTFNYVVSTVGGCGVASLSGVIIVKPEVTLTLTSAPISTIQSVCMNVLITPIKYSVTNGATGASVSGLPTGITGVYSGGVFTISGSTSQLGPFSYVVTTVGGCGSATQNGSITINPNVTIALTSAPATTLQTLCIDNPITPITYVVNNGATGASLIAGTVPDGIQGSFNPITKVFTISGIAIESGNFTYIISTTGGCGVATLTGTIRVSPIPVVALPQDGFICVDVAGVPTTQYLLNTNLSSSVYGFEWSDINGVLVGETGNSYTASAPGYYSVKVTNLATQCVNSAGATIVPSLPPSQVFTSVTSYFEDNQMVTISVTPPGNYLYQLDTGLFQSDPFFTNLFSGFHTITVKDRFGCGTAQDTFRIVNFPKFFTPNGDGYNDTWNITEIAVDQPDAYIYIFDRYGKLIREQSVIGLGWDGTFNGLDLPSTDYWFRVFYKENGASKEFKSHFSLKR